MIITIDGPASSGKTTVAKLLAKEINFSVLESGKFYRLFTYLLLTLKKEKWQEILENKEELESFWKSVVEDIKVEVNGEGTFLFFQNKKLEDELRSEEVEEYVSIVAKVPVIREIVNQMLRKIVQGKRIIAEGRDMGSVVFPRAKLKIFLTADEKIRAERRAKQEQRDPEKIIENIQKRDLIDSTRKVAPLKIPSDAIIIDTSYLLPKEVTEKILEVYKTLQNEKD